MEVGQERKRVWLIYIYIYTILYLDPPKYNRTWDMTLFRSGGFGRSSSTRWSNRRTIPATFTIYSIWGITMYQNRSAPETGRESTLEFSQTHGCSCTAVAAPVSILESRCMHQSLLDIMPEGVRSTKGCTMPVAVARSASRSARQPCAVKNWVPNAKTVSLA